MSRLAILAVTAVLLANGCTPSQTRIASKPDGLSHEKAIADLRAELEGKRSETTSMDEELVKIDSVRKETEKQEASLKRKNLLTSLDHRESELKRRQHRLSKEILSLEKDLALENQQVALAEAAAATHRAEEAEAARKKADWARSKAEAAAAAANRRAEEAVAARKKAEKARSKAEAAAAAANKKAKNAVARSETAGKARSKAEAAAVAANRRAEEAEAARKTAEKARSFAEATADAENKKAKEAEARRRDAEGAKSGAESAAAAASREARAAEAAAAAANKKAEKAEGEAAFVASAPGVRAYRYVDNVLPFQYEAPVDAVRKAAKRARGGKNIQESKMADERSVRIFCSKISDEKTRVNIRVGDFAGEANRQSAHSIHERIAADLGLQAPELVPAPRSVHEGELSRRYRAVLDACYHAALKACGERGYRPREYGRVGNRGGTISARGRGRTVYLSLYRTKNKRTRVTVQVQGGDPKASSQLHKSMENELRERSQPD